MEQDQGERRNKNTMADWLRSLGWLAMRLVREELSNEVAAESPVSTPDPAEAMVNEGGPPPPESDE